MIKFFRKIRQRLLTENKISKYLIYAIGEICLVVIGILIAVKINNFNTTQNLKKEELKTLVSLKKAIEVNLEEFKLTLENQEYRLESIEKILFTDLTNYTAKELDNIIGKSSDNYTFNPSMGILETLIYSGKLELINNDSIKKGASKLRDKFTDYQEEEGNAAQITKDYLLPYFINQYKIDPMVLSEQRERTEKENNDDKQFYIESISLPKVKNMYFLLLDRMHQIVTYEGKQLKQELQSLVSSIKLEIKNKKIN